MAAVGKGIEESDLEGTANQYDDTGIHFGVPLLFPINTFYIYSAFSTIPLISLLSFFGLVKYSNFFFSNRKLLWHTFIYSWMSVKF